MVQELHVDTGMISHVTEDRDGQHYLKGEFVFRDSLTLVHLVDSHAHIGAPKSLKIYSTCNFVSMSSARHIVNLGASCELGRIVQNVTSVEIVLGTHE
jgi:hypothetical protein